MNSDFDQALSYLEDASRDIDTAVSYMEDARTEIEDLELKLEDLENVVSILLPPEQYQQFDADREEYLVGLREAKAKERANNLCQSKIEIFAQGYMFGVKNRPLYDHIEDIKRLIDENTDTPDLSGYPPRQPT